MHIAHVSDLHLAATGGYSILGIDVHRQAATALGSLRTLLGPDDCLVITGDIAANGAPAEYRQFAELIDGLGCRILVVPGNHDDRDHLRHVMQDFPLVHLGPLDQTFMQYAVTLGGLTFVALDTLSPGHSYGELCAQRLEQLSCLLEAYRHRPVVILMHHPPVHTGVQSADRQRLGGAAQLGGLLKKCAQVEAILCGHAHRHVQIGWDGYAVVCAPSTAYLAAFDPTKRWPASFSHEAPGFLWHTWQPDVGLATYPASICFDEVVRPFQGSFGILAHPDR
jgi:3',5'-cyclic AMP phosphodiesterase CpdA